MTTPHPHALPDAVRREAESAAADAIRRVAAPVMPRDMAVAALDAILATLTAHGLRIVPAEPTEVMVRAGASVIDHPSVFMGGPSRQNLRLTPDVWAAMLSAAGAPDAP